MTIGPLLERIEQRVALDRQEGDIAYFNALMLELEFITKLVTASALACIADEPDRHKYSLEHKLVRADAIGEWVDALDAALTGPAAHYIIPNAAGAIRQLTERVGAGDWRYRAVSGLQNAAQRLSLQENIGAKVALRQLFRLVAAIRNRGRGHGATTGQQCTEVCPILANVVADLIVELHLFQIPWVYLHRNLSGKFRVTPLLGADGDFEYLKKTRDVGLPNGVFLYVGGPIQVPLVFSDADARDVFVPNGNFKAGAFEALSYASNDVVRKDASAWSATPGALPPSETEGPPILQAMGNTFGNVPPKSLGYVDRTHLEARLRQELLQTERHPIVSLTGPGGIGKTSLAIAAIEAVARLEQPPYDVVLWLSARDVDLLDSGPKPVAPAVVTRRDIARAAVALLEPSDRSRADFQEEAYFQHCLRNGAAGRTLFVLDNFETLESPSDVFQWVDTHIRLPHKVLITTRFRDFAGDYPIEVAGMTDDEATALIAEHASRLGIESLVDPRYRAELIQESDGHPYVLKILLGQVAKEGRAVKPERIVAAADHLLAALFERTYDKLSPAAQRVFLLLCSWRVFVPAVAVEAISLRPGNERFDVGAALTELRRFSLIDDVGSREDNEDFVGVPLSAASFGRRKLQVSPFKIAVEEDKRLLMEFGAGKREDAHRGVLPRIERLVQAVATKVSTEPGALITYEPVLEYLAARIPKAYLRLSDLMIETGHPERATAYLRRFLEHAELHDRQPAWEKLADLCHSLEDAMGEVHALGEAAMLPTVTPEDLGRFANRINNSIRNLKGRRVDEAWSPEVRVLLERVADVLNRHISQLSPTDLSRLAWLYLNIGNEARARDIALRGAEADPNNEHCRNLVRKLGT